MAQYLLTGRLVNISLGNQTPAESQDSHFQIAGSVGVANNTSWDSNTAPAPMNTLWKGAKAIWTESLKGRVKVRMTDRVYRRACRQRGEVGSNRQEEGEVKAGALRRCCRAWLQRANHPDPRLMAFALTSPTTTVNTPASKHLSINQKNGILDIACQGRGRGFTRTKKSIILRTKTTRSIA